MEIVSRQSLVLWVVFGGFAANVVDGRGPRRRSLGCESQIVRTPVGMYEDSVGILKLTPATRRLSSHQVCVDDIISEIACVKHKQT